MGKNPDTAYSLLPMAASQLDLPIDHFRLLGVSPSAEADVILRTLQLRIDRAPDQGFTHEALQQRAELLRLSADLLTDPSRRREYEATLMELGRDHPRDTAGLDLPSSREVAGLILLLEANAPHETFQLARQALQPPQAPALGSGREADLALLAGLACRAAAEQDQERRRYESAAVLLGEGLQLLQRVGKLPELRRILEQERDQLTPYRILDLLSRDLAEQVARREGLELLERFVERRGGLEGDLQAVLDQGSEPSPESGMPQGEFELFFQQIRRFLTVQEQVDLFERWQAQGSADAAFLGVMALTAAGFSRRKPERLDQARQRLRDLALEGLDTRPLQGCLDLLLGDVEHAQGHFQASTDAELQQWLQRHPGDDLAALCDYCRSWLGRDVLPGYRDVDAEAIDLEAWFADRDVQAFVERLERIEGRQRPAGFDSTPAFGLDPDGTLPLEIPSAGDPLADSAPWPGQPASPASMGLASGADSGSEQSAAGLSWRERLDQLPRPSRPALLASGILAVVVAVVAALSLIGLRREAEPSRLKPEGQPPTEQNKAEPTPGQPKAALRPEQGSQGSQPFQPLNADAPSETQLQTLLQTWLDRKATVLGGGTVADVQLDAVARDGLVSQVQQERSVDAAAGERQTVEASITSLELVSRTPQRIELRARVAYSDQRVDAAGKVIERTAATTLPITYILGRDGDTWRLHAYIPG